MIRLFLVSAAWLGLLVMALCQGAPPPIQRECRAVWVATVTNIDWPSSRTLSPAAQRAEAITILDKAAWLNLNTVILQVRPACDALYPSAIEPWSPYLTNAMGVGPSDGYDPLKFWIDEAHKRGLELHAWFNPYRALASTSLATSANHISRTRPDMVRTYGSALWLDPGHPEVPGYTRSVILDVLTRYDIDGVHMDDYFYPYPISGTPFPDDATYNAYLASGGTMSRADWRRDNVNKFVQNLYSMVRATKPWVKVGISPFGIWRPNNPPGVTGLDAYASLYADSRKWLREGWIDYLSPQLYWKISSTGQPYAPLLDWWHSHNIKNRSVWPGNFTSNIGTQYGNWPAQEILDQVSITRLTTPQKSGNVHFSMRALKGNWKSISDLLRQGHYKEQALIPAMTWLDPVPPSRPSVGVVTPLPGTFLIYWHSTATEPIARWLLSYSRNGVWKHIVFPAHIQMTRLAITTSEGSLDAAYIKAVDRAGNESAPVRIKGGIYR